MIVVAACGGADDSNTGFVATPTRTPRATPSPTAAPEVLPGTGFRSNGNTHIQPGEAHGEYFSNPPTSGWHYAELPSPGIYGTALTAEDVGHFIEHGGVWVLYNCTDACTDLVNQLVPVVNSSTQAGKPVALAPYPKMDKKIALVAWQRLDAFDAFDEGRVRTFIDKMVCRYNPEGGGICKETKGSIEPAVDARTAPPVPTPQAQAKSYASPPAMQIDVNKTYIATITTAKGAIQVTLNPKEAPISVNNFVFLARDGYYDGLTFHRVIPGFVAQGGDPKGDGTGGPGYQIQDERNALKHEEGVIAMAKSSAPNSAGSQFYITLAAQPALDGNYTVFGKVTAGMDVVKQIAKRDPVPGAPPGDLIGKITIEER